MNYDYADFAQEFPWFLPIVAGIFGAMVGSFLNVVIYRVPLGKSIVTPGSHCACGQPIRWFDNIPVFSWFILRGKARCCGRPYAFRYPAIEAITAALFVACILLFSPAKAVGGMVFLACLLAGTFTDLDHMIIPDSLTIGLAIVGVIFSFASPTLHAVEAAYPLMAHLRSGFTAVIGLLIGSAVILWIATLAEAVLKKEAMGFGDVKLMGAIGAFCGWQGALFAIFGGAIIGCVWMALAKIWQAVTGKKTPITPKMESAEGVAAEELGLGVQVPFGPMLSVGAAIYFLWAHRWFDAFLGEFVGLINGTL
jgi:leader peptidase (prepilin peptidase) / N-methyltransferase